MAEDPPIDPAETRDEGNCQSAPRGPKPPLYPYDFSRLREGDHDPTLNKDVQWLIESSEDFIVYLDEDDFVEWNMNATAALGPDTGPYLNIVGRLEAVDTGYLSTEQVKSYQRLIGEGVARLFQKNLQAAQTAFDFAERWVIARNNEVARQWLLVGSGCAALLTAVAVLVLGFWAVKLRSWLGPGVFDILLGSAAGGLGAWLSVIQRSRTSELDVAAGPRLHYLEGAFRIMAGSLGSFLVAVAIRAGLLPQVTKLSAMVVICMVAGTSERLVPSFIEQIEKRTATPTGS